MDDLLAHLKAINDPTCKFLRMPYMDYMAKEYTHGSNTKDKGLHRMPNSFATDVLERYCQALITYSMADPLPSLTSGMRVQLS